MELFVLSAQIVQSVQLQCLLQGEAAEGMWKAKEEN